MSEPQNPQFRKKSREDLEKQTKEVSGRLGEELVPPSKEADVFSMNVEEIRKKYGARYRIYLEMLRRQSEANPEKSARIIRALNNLDQYISRHKSHQEKTTLYERQLSVFEDLHGFFEEGETEGYIKLPTGAGKTVIFSEFIEATGLKTLIVVPTKILVGQTEEKLAEFAEGVDVGKIYSEAKEHGHQVTITTYDSFVSNVANGQINPQDFDLLILDEAHKSLTEKRIAAVRAFKDTLKIGFTATPRYSDDKQVSNLLNSEIHSMNTREAVEEGMLCPCSVIIAETECDTSNVKVESNGDYSEAELARAINNESRNRAALELYRQAFRDEAAVAYCCGVDHAEDLARLFSAAGVPAAVISGRQSASEQNAIKKKYANGEIQVLCNADILIEGFDEPRASVCLNLRPTLSQVVAEQRAGRVLRIDETHPSKFAKIVDFLDRNTNGKHAPITFAEIIDGARIDGISRATVPQQERAPSYRPSIVINGLTVTTDPREVMRIVKDIEKKKYHPAPEGWATRHGLVKQVGKDYSTVARIAKKYKKTNPEWYDLFLDEHNELYEHLAPALVQIIVERLTSYEKAPAGWMTNTSLAEAIDKSFGAIRNLAENYRAGHPEWFRQYLGVRDQLAEHYAPELCFAILTDVTEQEAAPEGWATATAVGEKAGKTVTTVKKYAEKYRKEHPEWFHDYLNVKNRVFEHYAPELVAILVEELTKYQEAPEGWTTVSQITESTGKDERQINRIADRYRPEHPEWYENYFDKAGAVRQHFSPELTSLITTEFAERKAPPEGWLNATQAAREIGVGYHFLKNMAPKYVLLHPEWAGFYYTVKKEPVEFYSPELVKLMREEKQSQKKAPSGWITASALAIKAGRGTETVQQTADKYREEHPEWFADYYNKSGNTYEHFAPELVRIILKDVLKVKNVSEGVGEAIEVALELEKAPEGWQTNPSLRRELHRADKTIEAAAEEYRGDHPEWFRNYRAGGLMAEYYSPELVEKLREQFPIYEKAPEGWETIGSFQEKLGKHSFYKIKEIGDAYRTSHPEWFQKYATSVGQIEEYLAPELIKIIEDELAKLVIPEGWESSSGLVEKTGSAQQTIQRRAEKYRKEHPEWFIDQKYEKLTRIFYHPDLVQILIAEFGQFEAAPEGWMTANEIMTKTGKKNFYRIRDIAEKYRPAHPEWFKKFKPIRGLPTEYYSPELSKLVLEEYMK